MEGSSSDYSRLVEAVERARRLVEALEAEPFSPKRDVALESLRRSLGDAIRRLGDEGWLADAGGEQPGGEGAR